MLGSKDIRVNGRGNLQGAEGARSPSGQGTVTMRLSMPSNASSTEPNFSVGGGLFTSTGSVAPRPYEELFTWPGVSTSPTPPRNTGLYAAPRMIYHILEKNGLSSFSQARTRRSLAPAPDFGVRSDRRSPVRSGLHAPPTRTGSARSSSGPVDAIDGKLDEILRLLKKPH